MSQYRSKSSLQHLKSSLNEQVGPFASMSDSVSQMVEKKLLPRYFNSPLRIQLDLTSQCNLSCIQCYNNSGVGSNIKFTKPELGQLIDDLADMKVLDVTISGGEPFITQDELFYVLDGLLSKNIAAKVLTNGSFINEAISDKLAKYNNIYELQVSIDGANPETHDYIRQHPGSWENAVKSTKLLINKGIRTVIGTVVMKPNFKEIPDLIDFSFCLGVDAIKFGDIIEAGRAANDNTALSLDNDEYAYVNSILKEKELAYRRLMSISLSFDAGLALELDLKLPNRSCVIKANGDVWPGCLVPYAVGNIRETSIKEIWQNNLRQRNEDPKYIEKVKSAKSRLKELRRDEW